MVDKKLNTVIIDDDAHSRKLLQVLLKKFPEINIVGEASNITSAIEVIRKTKPDSLFLDVCLDDQTGFELMNEIKSNPKIVIVSAYDNYALRAFDINALDYIQKPIAPERLAKAVDRLLTSFKEHNAAENNATKNNEHSNDETLLKEAHVNDDQDDDTDDVAEQKHTNGNTKVLEYDDRLFITVDGISKFIKINNIICITAEKDYSYIYLTSGKKHLVLKSMVEWEERLTPKYFVRIHRSTIVNLEHVEKVEKWFNSSYHVYLQNQPEPFKMSRRYAAKLKERFK